MGRPAGRGAARGRAQCAGDAQQGVGVAVASGAGDDAAAVGGAGADGAVVDLVERQEFADAECVEDTAGGLAAGQDEVAVVRGLGDRAGQSRGEAAGRAGVDGVGAVDADDGDAVRVRRLLYGC